MSPRLRVAVSFLQLQIPPYCPERAVRCGRLPQFIASVSRHPTPFRRSLATHSDRPFPNPNPGASSSSSSGPSAPSTEELLRRLDAEARRRGKTGFEGQEAVGPFPLGVGPSGRSKGWKRWSELGIGGKVVRAGRQTGNLSVIVVGGALFVILAFALSTELFAKNSPSVLYSQAVDIIRASDALNPHLLPPLSFTHTPHSSSPARGSPALPTRHIQHPRSGREHLLLTFWVHGRGIGEEESLGWAKRYYRNVLGWARDAGEWAGLVPPSPTSEAAGTSASSNASSGQVQASASEVEGGTSWLGGLFGGITSLRGGQVNGAKSGSSKSRGLPPPGTYKIGEVHGDYVKNAAGTYQLLSLVIDIPASQAPQPTRAVVFWSSEADTEGLLGRRR